MGPPAEGEVVQVRWTDGQVYGAKFVASHPIQMYQVAKGFFGGAGEYLIDSVFPPRGALGRAHLLVTLSECAAALCPVCQKWLHFGSPFFSVLDPSCDGRKLPLCTADQGFRDITAKGLCLLGRWSLRMAHSLWLREMTCTRWMKSFPRGSNPDW